MHTSDHIHICLLICFFFMSVYNINGARCQMWQLEFSKLMLILTAVKVLASAPHWYMLSSSV